MQRQLGASAISWTCLRHDATAVKEALVGIILQLLHGFTSPHGIMESWTWCRITVSILGRDFASFFLLLLKIRPQDPQHGRETVIGIEDPDLPHECFRASP